MAAIASLEDSKAAHKDLVEAKDLDDLKKVLRNGVASVERMCASCGCKREHPNN